MKMSQMGELPATAPSSIMMVVAGGTFPAPLNVHSGAWRNRTDVSNECSNRNEANQTRIIATCSQTTQPLHYSTVQRTQPQITIVMYCTYTLYVRTTNTQWECPLQCSRYNFKIRIYTFAATKYSNYVLRDRWRPALPLRFCDGHDIMMMIT